MKSLINYEDTRSIMPKTLENTLKIRIKNYFWRRKLSAALKTLLTDKYENDR